MSLLVTPTIDAALRGSRVAADARQRTKRAAADRPQPLAMKNVTVTAVSKDEMTFEGRAEWEQIFCYHPSVPRGTEGVAAPLPGPKLRMEAVSHESANMKTKVKHRTHCVTIKTDSMTSLSDSSARGRYSTLLEPVLRCVGCWL